MNRRHVLAIVALLVIAVVYKLLTRPDDASRGASTGGSASEGRKSEARIEDDDRGTSGSSSGTARSARIGALANRAPIAKEVPDSIALDAMYPGAYDEFRVAIDRNVVIRKALRRCSPKLPPNTTEVAYAIALSFVYVDGKHVLQEATLDYEGEKIDDYMECVRAAYLDAAPSLRLSPNAPALVRAKTTARFYLSVPESRAQIRERIDRLHDELSRDEDDADRAITQDLIDFYECLERVGIERRSECL
ncbi:MAG: hypothetical protein AB7T06_47205 [Kofleriaceae bacterium]